MAHAPSVASLLGMVTAFRIIPRSTSEFIYTITFVHSHFYNIFTYLMSSSWMLVSWSLVQLFSVTFFLKKCMYHNFVFCEGVADTGVRVEAQSVILL